MNEMDVADDDDAQNEMNEFQYVSIELLQFSFLSMKWIAFEMKLHNNINNNNVIDDDDDRQLLQC